MNEGMEQENQSNSLFYNINSTKGFFNSNNNLGSVSFCHGGSKKRMNDEEGICTETLVQVTFQDNFVLKPFLFYIL